MRADGRAPDQLRTVVITRNYLRTAPGAVLICFGDTRVLCTATIESRVPPFLRDSGRGWVTAEYAMLPASSGESRIPRDAVRKGRALEISRLIGRSLRSIMCLESLGEQQITIDCDVIQADGGTRTAAITGAYVALHDAVTHMIGLGLVTESPICGQCAAVSLGIIEEQCYLDLSYQEDVAADVDFNLVMKNDGTMIEIQGTAEGRTFGRDTLTRLLDLGECGIRELFERQDEALLRRE